MILDLHEFSPPCAPAPPRGSGSSTSFRRSPARVHGDLFGAAIVDVVARDLAIELSLNGHDESVEERSSELPASALPRPCMTAERR
jgi:hypothetical protein